jgi:hypothetical protein
MFAGLGAELVAEAGADVGAVGGAAWGAAVAGGDDLLALDDDGAELSAEAGASGGDLAGDVEVVLVLGDPPGLLRLVHAGIFALAAAVCKATDLLATGGGGK